MAERYSDFTVREIKRHRGRKHSRSGGPNQFGIFYKGVDGSEVKLPGTFSKDQIVDLVDMAYTYHQSFTNKDSVYSLQRVIEELEKGISDGEVV